MDKELQEVISYIGKRFDETSQQIQGLREEMTRELATVREEIRHAHVLIEGVHSNVRLVAEGVIGMGERMDSFRTEVTTEVKNIRSLVQNSYTALEHRVHALESWRETRERDPIDIMREKFGRRPES